jgi:hypothetical protein
MYTQKNFNIIEVVTSLLYKYTNKHNLSASVFFTTAQNVSYPTEYTTSVSRLVLTRSSRSSDIDWSACVFCQCKTCKRDQNKYTRLHPMREQKDCWT